VERTRLSYTSFSTYQQCPLQYRFRYVDRLDWQPRPALSFGESLHAALEWFYSGQTPHPPDLPSLLRQLEKVWVSEGYADAEEEERYLEHAREVLTVFHRANAPRYRLPASVEQPFQVDMGDFLLTGRIDRLDRHPDGTYEIIDYKTNRKLPPLARLSEDYQLPLYQLAATRVWGIKPGKLTLYYLLPNQRFTTRPWSEERLESMVEELRATAEAIARGLFPPRPNHLCPWCDFASLGPEAPSSEGGLAGLIDRYADLLERRVGLDRLIGELERKLVEEWPEGRKTLHSRRHRLMRLSEGGAPHFRLDDLPEESDLLPPTED
jgi:RecB family exonuclease